MHGAYLPPSYHQTVKQHLLPTLNLSHIGVLIIDSLLYRQQNATEITEHRRIDGIKPSLRFDRLSHLIITLKHWEEGRSGGEYALDSCTSKGVSVLNIFKALCLENIILYFFFFSQVCRNARIKWDRGNNWLQATKLWDLEQVCIWNFPLKVQTEMWATAHGR